MPTATATMVNAQELLGASTTSVLSLKPSKTPSVAAESSTAATLRSLYSRAGNAFVHRDFALTHSLLTAAFALITPPTYTTEDEIAAYRRKWEILRITVETAIYSEGADTIPSELRENQSLSPQSLVTKFHIRSLQLFTPTSLAQQPTSTFLSHQILHTLVLSSVMLGCYDIGRRMIEDWLARRQQDLTDDERGGYGKILKLYCLDVLPRLEEWDYAEDFLQYERELEVETRRNIVFELREKRRRAAEVRQPQSLQSSSTTASSTSRPASPAYSVSSDSSTSTHTATPRTPNPVHGKGKEKVHATKPSLNGLAYSHPSLSPSPSRPSPISSPAPSATTSKTVTPISAHRSRSRSRHNASPAIRSSAASPLPRHSSSSARVAVSTSSVRVPSTLALVRSFIEATLRNASRSKLMGLFLVFVVFPVVSLALRVRRSNLKMTQGAGAADAVRRRLRGTQASSIAGTGTISAMWGEVVRAVGDTIRMGGGGLA